jgi:geranylgeranyl diphosphate synthase, type I
MPFINQLEYYKKIIDSELKIYLNRKFSKFSYFKNSFIDLQFSLAAESCLSGGKRLRPILTIMAYKAVGGHQENKIYLPSLAFEIYHNYTLIHDDIYDEDYSRRGRTTNHVIFENQFRKKYPDFKDSIFFRDAPARFGVVSGIINGKYLHTLSSFPILEADMPEQIRVAGMLLHQSVSIYDNTGQAIDLAFEMETEVKKNDYFNMVECKTGRLLQAAIEWGAILGKASNLQRKALKEYIGELAIAFQIRDDIMDIEEGTKGRGLGSDIKQRKKTLLAIHTLKKSSPSDKKKFLQIFGKKDANSEEINKAIEIIKKSGAIDYCRNEAKKRIEKAINLLNSAKPALEPKSKQFFIDLADYMLERKK